jgi:hypothetical protein
VREGGKEREEKSKSLLWFGFFVVDHVVQDVANVLQTFNKVGGGRVLDDGGEGLGDGLFAGWRGDVCDNGGLRGQDNLRVVEEINLNTS